MSQTVAEQKADTPPAEGSLRSFLANNPAAVLWRSMVGKKIVMAVTGLVLVGFIVGHVVGNLHAFQGADHINEYAAFLRHVGEPLVGHEQLLWGARVVLLVSAALHIVAAYQLTMMNYAARPQNYGSYKPVRTSIAALTMRYSGVLLALFIVFHILHLTLGWVWAGAASFRPETDGKYFVYENVVATFKNPFITGFYVISMAALALHLDHGVWSMFQTLGWNTRAASRPLRLLSRGVAALVFVGFIAVPVAVLAGLVH